MRLALVLALAIPVALDAQDPDEREIRRARASSNEAIARHDTAGIGAAMAEDVVVVTSRSVHQVGRAGNLQSFAEQFRSRPDVWYERRPGSVLVFTPWGMASETGAWTGGWTDTDGRIRIGGSYFAKWRKVNGAWRVESETYVPTHCEGGAYCRTPP